MSYSYGISWGISCVFHFTKLRCFLKLVTQIFSSMIKIIDSWFSCYFWFLHHAEILWTYSNVFILLYHQVDISLYIDSIHQSKFYEEEESTTRDLHSMDHIHHHVWFPVSKSLVQPFGLWTNLSHFINGLQMSKDSKIKWLRKSIYMEFLYALFLIWPKWRFHA